MTGIFTGLLRPRLAVLNGIATAGGYLLFPGNIDPISLVVVLVGVAFLAAGGSALNQVLERDLDRLKARTMDRPIPTGRLTVTAATAIGMGSILAGLLLLGRAYDLIPLLLGCLGLVWYLAVYTPLKRRSALALPVGAVCGALPPLIGWSFAGGDPTDFQIIFLAGVLYLWQIPHFWLIQRRHVEDYRKAGIPLLPAVSSQNDLSGIFRLWMAALVTMALLLPAFGIIRDNTALLYSFFLLPLVLLPFIRSERIIFSYINFFPLLVTVALCFQGMK